MEEYSPARPSTYTTHPGIFDDDPDFLEIQTYPRLPRPLRKVVDDMENCGIEPAIPREFEDYEDFEITVGSLTRHLFANKEQRQVSGNTQFAPATHLGKVIHQVLNSNKKLVKGDDGCCYEAEVRLLRTIDSDNVLDDQFQSPLIVVDGNQPVGIIKTNGEKTLYGLETVPSRNIIEGAFESTYLSDLVPELPRTSHAWQIDIGETGSCKPVKLSTMLTSKASRAKLDYDDFTRPTRNYNHADIRAQVAKLQKTAVPIDGLGNIIG